MGSRGSSGGSVNTGAVGQQQALENQKIVARERVKRLFGEGDPDAYVARRKLYTDTGQAARELNKTYLDEDAQRTRGTLLTNLLRSGLYGGSADINANADVNRRYNEGITQIGDQSDALERALEAEDEQTKFDLLDKIGGGMDAATAVSMGSSRMANAAQNAAQQARGRLIGDLFGNVADTYGAYQYGQGRTEGTGQIPLPPSYGRRSTTSARPRTILWGDK